MRILFFDWGTYTFSDICGYFVKTGIEYQVFRYQFTDKNKDDSFCEQFGQILQSGAFDAVYSTNYFPLVAECCLQNQILYISWSYDNPLNVNHIEETLGHETNRVFFFDRMQVAKYQEMGYSNIYYLPLAINSERLAKIQLDASERKQYAADISMVGQMYASQLDSYMSVMTDYQKGYLQGVCNAQSKLYGAYLVDEVLTDTMLEEVNAHVETLRGDRNLIFSREALSYAVSTYVTGKERILLLALLSNHFQVKLYSGDRDAVLQNPVLQKVDYMGTVDYQNQMPKVFQASKINLNVNLKISQSGIPLRAIDILGAGGFLLSSYQPELAEYFEPNREVVLYESIEDAYEKVKWYLQHESERALIAARGCDKARKCFSYERQMARLFELAGI